MPTGEELTVPVLVPTFVTVRVYVFGAFAVKLAMIVWFVVTLENVYVDTAPTEAPSTSTFATL